MGYVSRVTVPVVPATASGSTAFSPKVLNGLCYAVGFSPSTVNPWSTAADFTVIVEGGTDLLHVDLNASLGEQMFWPRRTANTTSSGVFDPVGGASGREAVMVPFADQRARIVVASGGVTTSGTVNFYMV